MVENAFTDKKKIDVTWISTDNLSVVWSNAQRPLEERFAKSIADNFDPDKFGMLAVTAANAKGTHHIIDGQHRKRAIEIAFGPGQKVPCQVFEAADPMRAAELFDEINSHRRKPHTVDFFNVRVTARDEDHLAVVKILKENGLHVGYNRTERQLSAVQALLGIYRRHGGAVLDQTLKVMTATWGIDGGAFLAPLIRGFGEFMAEHGDAANWQKVKDGVSRLHTPESFLAAAKNRRKDYGGSLTTTVRDMIIVMTNRGQKTAKRIHDPKKVTVDA